MDGIPDGFVVCPACDGGGESEHWTTCGLCREWAEKDPRYDQIVAWDSYCPTEVAHRYVGAQIEYWKARAERIGLSW